MGYYFGILLFLAVVITGAAKFCDVVFFKKERVAKANALRAELKARGESEENIVNAQEEALRGSWISEGVAGFFPVLFIIFVLRSFVIEPFRIPSGSMLPTLENGDMILVNKFTYGIRLPVVNTKIVPIGEPARGDVVVFRYPVNPKEDYIKRIVGLPGDVITYKDKVLSINGSVITQTATGPYINPEQVRRDFPVDAFEFNENLNDVNHRMLVYRNIDSPITPDNFDGRNNCQYEGPNFSCKVPAGHYFAMGDNRDDSLDSRFWGFVPEENLVGKAFFIWMNFGHLGRIGTFQ